MEDFVFVDTINIAKFEKEEFNPMAEENAHVLEHLNLTPDGKILAVRREKVADLAKSKEIFLVRMKLRKPPKSIDVKTEEDFWRVMAYLVDLDEDL